MWYKNPNMKNPLIMLTRSHLCLLLKSAAALCLLLTATSASAIRFGFSNQPTRYVQFGPSRTLAFLDETPASSDGLQLTWSSGAGDAVGLGGSIDDDAGHVLTGDSA